MRISEPVMIACQPAAVGALTSVCPISRYLDRAPDLVVEICSPEDTVAAQLRKFDEYFETEPKWLG